MHTQNLSRKNSKSVNTYKSKFINQSLKPADKQKVKFRNNGYI